MESPSPRIEVVLVSRRTPRFTAEDLAEMNGSLRRHGER
jgi:hypothetical protein